MSELDDRAFLARKEAEARVLLVTNALAAAASRFEDLAQIIKEDGPYADHSFLKASAERCYSALRTSGLATDWPLPDPAKEIERWSER